MVITMKIGVYTDSHYSSQRVSCGCRYNCQSLRKIREAYAHFEQKGCEWVICLGDLIDTESTTQKEVENLSAIAEVIRSSAVPTVCLMGNHDAFTLTPAVFYQTLGLPAPQELHLQGKRLLFLDACYFRNGQHYGPGGGDWTDTFYPDAEGLLSKLKESDEDTYVFVHQNIDPAVDHNHRIANADTLFAHINHSRTVKAVFQGHYHPGYRSEYHGVRYVTLPAMCENENAFFVFDI